MDDLMMGVIIVVDSFEYEIVDQEIIFIWDGFIMVFFYNSSIDWFEICEVIFYFVDVEVFDGEFFYLIVVGDFCWFFDNEDLIVVGIE